MLDADTWVRSFEANATDAFQSMFSFTSAVGSGITAIPTLQCITNWSFYTGVAVVAGLPVLVALLALLITLAAFLVVAFRERNSHTRPAPTTPRDGSQVEPASEATPFNSRLHNFSTLGAASAFWFRSIHQRTEVYGPSGFHSVRFM